MAVPSAPSSVLIPSIKVCRTNNCLKVEVFDTTCPYSNSNLNGWGLPNVSITSIVSASLDISVYEPVTDQFSLVTGEIDVSSILPNISGIPYVATIGVSDIYYFLVTYTTDTGAVYTADFYYVNLCDYYCCYDKKLAASCGCQGGSIELFNIWTLLQSAEATTCCGTNIAAILDIIKKLKKYCSDCDCGCK